MSDQTDNSTSDSPTTTTAQHRYSSPPTSPSDVTPADTVFVETDPDGDNTVIIEHGPGSQTRIPASEFHADADSQSQTE